MARYLAVRVAAVLVLCLLASGCQGFGAGGTSDASGALAGPGTSPGQQSGQATSGGDTNGQVVSDSGASGARTADPCDLRVVRRPPSGPYVLLLAPPERGHLNPILGLAVALQARGTEVLVGVVGHEAWDAAAAVGVPAWCLASEPIPAATREAKIISLVRSGSTLEAVRFVTEWEEAINAAILPGVRWLLGSSSTGRGSGINLRPQALPSVLVSDALLLPMCDVAAHEAGGTPCVVVCPTLVDVLGFSAHSPLTLPYIASGLPTGTAVGSGSSLIASAQPSFLPRLMTLGWRILAGAIRYGVRYRRKSAWRHAHGLPALPWGGVQGLVEDRNILVLAPLVPGLEPPRPMHPAVHLVGPMLPLDTSALSLAGYAELNSWVNQTPDPFVFVSLGSLAVVDGDQLLAILEGLLGTRAPKARLAPSAGGVEGVRSVWARGQELFTRENLLEHPSVVAAQASGRLLLAGYAPQGALLSHPQLGAFVSHAGSGSTNEALAAGVPVLAVPLFGDQFRLAQRLKEMGVARVLDSRNLTATAVSEGMAALLQCHEDDGEKPLVQSANWPCSSSFGRAARVWSTVAATAGGAARGAALVEMVAATRGGPHLRPYDASWSFLARWSVDTLVVVAVLVWLLWAGCVRCCRCACHRHRGRHGHSHTGSGHRRTRTSEVSHTKKE